MAVKAVLKIGNPLLNRVAVNVEHIDENLKQGVIQNMLDTMQAEKGAGIAAIQIGDNLRIIIFGIEKNPRYPEAEPIPTTVLINPEVNPVDDEVIESWEGCLSVPGYRGLVPRYAKIRYSGYTENNEYIDRTVDGFHAIVVQHEVDHLDGILYPQRIKNMLNFGLMDELEKFERIPKIEPEKND